MKLITAIVFIIILASCKTKSCTIIHIDTSKLPKDSLGFYFPAKTFSNTPSADSFVQNWYSSALYSFKEAILSQSFVGHNIYRFLWLRSFLKPVVFTLNNSNGQVWLNTKILDMQPRFYNDRIRGLIKEEQEQYIKIGFFVDKNDPDLLVRIADRKANIIYNNCISLSDIEWSEFEELLAKVNFWQLPTEINNNIADGSPWVIEGHFKNRYHVVDYTSPSNNDYAKAGLFLIKLSGLEEKKF